MLSFATKALKEFQSFVYLRVQQTAYLEVAKTVSARARRAASCSALHALTRGRIRHSDTCTLSRWSGT